MPKVNHYKVSVGGSTAMFVHIYREYVNFAVWSDLLGDFIDGRRSRSRAAEMLKDLRNNHDAEVISI